MVAPDLLCAAAIRHATTVTYVQWTYNICNTVKTNRRTDSQISQIRRSGALTAITEPPGQYAGGCERDLHGALPRQTQRHCLKNR